MKVALAGYAGLSGICNIFCFFTAGPKKSCGTTHPNQSSLSVSFAK